MFDQSLHYTLVQIKRNKFPQRESFLQEFIYKFYRHNSRCCIKYIVSVKAYPEGLLTLDYYPKINLTPKINSMDDIQDLRYRMLTRQNSFGVIGGTILDIMVDATNRTGSNIWGFLAANLPNETENYNNRRFQVYKEILSRIFVDRYEVFENKENSAIFVIPNELTTQVEKIIEHYEQVFAETN